MRTVPLELAPYGITANCVAPGEIATPMTGREDSDPRDTHRPGAMSLGCRGRRTAACRSWVRRPGHISARTPGAHRGGWLSEVGAESIEDAPAARLAVRSVGPELVEEDPVLDLREPGALVDRLELERRHRRRHVKPVEPHVVGRDDADVLDDVGVRGLVP